MEKFNTRKGLIAALAAVAVGLVLFLILFGNPLSQRIIYSNEFGQSQKLIDIWKTVEPLPAITPFVDNLFDVTPKKFSVILILYFWTLGVVRLYAYLKQYLPENHRDRVLMLSYMLWLMFLFFEVFFPFNILGEPFLIVCYELFLDGIISVSVAWTIVKLYTC